FRSESRSELRTLFFPAFFFTRLGRLLRRTLRSRLGIFFRGFAAGGGFLIGVAIRRALALALGLVALVLLRLGVLCCTFGLLGLGTIVGVPCRLGRFRNCPIGRGIRLVGLGVIFRTRRITLVRGVWRRIRIRTLTLLIGFRLGIGTILI